MMGNIELFDKYLTGDFSSHEKKSFESRLNSDPDLLSEFRVYLSAVLGICHEAEQDNKDFEEALKHISKEELLSIIGAGDKKTPPTNSDKPSSFKKWLLWQSIGVAALLGLGIVYLIIVRNEANSVKQNALAMNQEALNQVDNAIYAFSDYSHGISRSGGIDISNLSDEELQTQIATMESIFREQTDDLDIVEYGSELVMVYIRLHEREKAKQLLMDLITQFQDNSDYLDDVINWKTILSLLK